MKSILYALISLTSIASAHHGLDFMILQDTGVPAPWHGVFFNNFIWEREVSADGFEDEGGVYLGLTEGIGLGVITQFSDGGDGWKYGAVTPYAVINLLPADSETFRVALWAGYEFADETDTQVSGTISTEPHTKQTTHRSQKRSSPAPGINPTPTPKAKRLTSPPPSGGSRQNKHTGGGGGGTGPDAPTGGGHDHPTAPTAPPPPSQPNDPEPEEEEVEPVKVEEHDHENEAHDRGIHRHGQSGLHTRLIIEANLSEKNKIVANLINFTPENGKGAWGYALGFRHAFTHDVAMSLEAIGDFDAELQHQVLVAGHFSPTHWATLRLGASVGLTDASPDFSLNTGLILRF